MTRRLSIDTASRPTSQHMVAYGGAQGRLELHQPKVYHAYVFRFIHSPPRECHHFVELNLYFSMFLVSW